jgi:hypothetical protein
MRDGKPTLSGGKALGSSLGGRRRTAGIAYTAKLSAMSSAPAKTNNSPMPAPGRAPASPLMIN